MTSRSTAGSVGVSPRFEDGLLTTFGSLLPGRKPRGGLELVAEERLEGRRATAFPRTAFRAVGLPGMESHRLWRQHRREQHAISRVCRPIEDDSVDVGA